MKRFGERFLAAVVLVLVLTVSALAVDYTITFSADEAKLLSALVTNENVSRVSQGLSPWTTSEYLTYATTSALDFQWKRIRRRLMRQKSEDAKNAFVGVQ